MKYFSINNFILPLTCYAYQSQYLQSCSNMKQYYFDFMSAHMETTNVQFDMSKKKIENKILTTFGKRRNSQKELYAFQKLILAKKLYQIYSAMILSVYGVMSKLSRSSSLLTVLSSDFKASTLNLAELLFVPFLFCFINRELHIFVVIGLAMFEYLGILICHCIEGAKICAIFTYSSLES